MAGWENYWDDYVKKIKEKIAKIMHKVLYETWDEYFDYADKEVHSYFEDAVGEFYKSYTPKIYSRTYSLENILSTQKFMNNDDYVYYQYEFLPNKMSYYRNEKRYYVNDLQHSLYNLVFVEGYHGGAKSGPDHPEGDRQGKPLWRTKHPWYTRWGQDAEQMTVSGRKTGPLSMIEEKITYFRENIADQKLNEIYQKKYNQYMSKF